MSDETESASKFRTDSGIVPRYHSAVTYEEALAFLHSLKQFGFQPGLETTRRLAAAVGNPQERLRFIHVAGTNGKGSTCAMLESVYRAAGLKTGLYTSPHLVRFGERIQVDRRPLPEAELARLVMTLRSRMSDGLEVTFFEFTTVVALMWFAEQPVDVVVWETGLGGRLDSTNIVTPLASLITNIGMDHMHVLGGTLGEIAAEKAGIIKPGVPVLTSADSAEALSVIEFKAREMDAPLIQIGAPALMAMKYPLSLLGPHQKINAALAAATVRLLRPVLPVSDEQLARGLATTIWAGRMQVVRRGGRTLVLDGAHNRDGIAALRRTLASEFEGSHPTLLVGMLRDKQWREMARELAPLALRIVTAPVSSPRTVTPSELREAFQKSGVARAVKPCESIDEALKSVAPDPFVLITGSLYFIGEVMERLGIEPGGGGDERSLNEWGGGTARSV